MIFPFAFFIGVVASLAMPVLPPAWVAMPVALAAAGGLCWRRHFAAGLALSGVCCGLLFAGYHAWSHLAMRWPASLDDERVIASVVVDSIPAPRGEGWAFDACVDIEAPSSLRRALRARLLSRDATLRPHAGERWQLLLTLRSPRGHANPGTQDLERMLFRDGVHALGTVVPSRLNRRIDSGHRPLAGLRERISRHIDAQVMDRDAAALIAALAVGDTGPVSREQWRVFNATGTTHLVAISGLHVTLFAVVAFAVASRLWSMAVGISSLRWLTAGPRETFASVIAFGSAAAYATLAGLSVPTQRTLIMLGAWLLTRSAARASKPFQPFALALLAVLVLDPFAPLSAGFWLSFAAMAAIILATSGRFMRRPWWLEALAVQAAVTVALLPFSVALFGSVSLIGPFVNVAAIPAMSCVLVPTVLLAVVLWPVSTGASSIVLDVAAWLHDTGWPLLAAASDLPWALVYLSPPWWWYPLALASVLMSLMPWPLSLRLAALLCSIPLAAAANRAPQPGTAEVTILDVGQGASMVVRTSGHVLVHGTGDVYGSDGRVAESVLVPFLRSVGVRAVDVLILSRMSPATAAGATALFAAMPVRETLVGGAASVGDDGVRNCSASHGAWQWDGVVFELLPPCMLSVRTARGRVLVPGDIDAHDEADLLSDDDLHADLVIVPRNGSDRASSTGFIAAVDARWAVVNGRRVPRSGAGRALARWEEQGAHVLATAETGAIAFQIDRERGLAGPESRRVDRYGGQLGGRRTLWSTSP